MPDLICEDDEQLDLGPCCACGRAGDDVRHVVMLHVRQPEEGRGKGWGCFQCGLPPDGACVVLCDICMRLDATAWQTACVGYPSEGLRVPLADLTEPFDHHMAYHPESWAWTEEVSDTCGVCRKPLPDPDADEDLDEDVQPDIPLHLWRDNGREGLQMHWACAQACVAAGTLTMRTPGEREDNAP
jgi:hypothetical protein